MEKVITLHYNTSGQIKLIKITKHMEKLEDISNGDLPLPEHPQFSALQMRKMVDDHYLMECIRLRTKHRRLRS